MRSFQAHILKRSNLHYRFISVHKHSTWSIWLWIVDRPNTIDTLITQLKNSFYYLIYLVLTLLWLVTILKKNSSLRETFLFSSEMSKCGSLCGSHVRAPPPPISRDAGTRTHVNTIKSKSGRYNKNIKKILRCKLTIHEALIHTICFMFCRYMMKEST